VKEPGWRLPSGDWGQAKSWDLGLVCASLETAVSQGEGMNLTWAQPFWREPG
jgi:hypothetical protein